ncbi:SAG-related sequence SRS46 [Besnoitia besnoiti]|uniref:SAG-related sequence SRS46 n=1 Tax=Besnoitia besnoiti TaxID=94643 RepID=A0A2A9MMS8_BESBE|nr:SAG-related sequence SRS46 [Besnoitia besnoiti]PFH37123.1 SAG-related sequence SRS46 [Besnoitia besnoiti]
MKLSSVPVLAAAATGAGFLLPLSADAAGVPAVCDSPANPLKFVSEANAALRIRCGKDFPELVPIDGRVFAVDQDGTCGAGLVDPETVQVAVRPVPSSEQPGVKKPKTYLVNFTKSEVETDTTVCLRCAHAPETVPASPAQADAEDACVIYVALKATDSTAQTTGPTAEEEGPTAAAAVASGTEMHSEEGREAEMPHEAPTPEGAATGVAQLSAATETQGQHKEDALDAVGPVIMAREGERSEGPHICSGSEEKLTVAPKQQVTFGCGSSMNLEPTDRKTVFAAGADEKCSGAPVSLETVLPGAELTSQSAAGQELFTFSPGTTTLKDDKRLCYICSSSELAENKTRCRVLITVSANAFSRAHSAVALGLVTVLLTYFALAF